MAYSERWSSDYMEFAGLLHFEPGSEAASWRFGLVVGPVLSHLAKNERFRLGGTQTEPPDLRSTSVGAAAGITLTRSRFLGEVRYQGFNDQLASGAWMIHHYVAVLFGVRIL